MNIRKEARQILLDFNKKNEGLTFQEAEDKLYDLAIRSAIFWREKDNEATD